ncbi:MAG: M14 family zinc carboxypeptidase, partial [Planctomycetota bacterium]
ASIALRMHGNTHTRKRTFRALLTMVCCLLTSLLVTPSAASDPASVLPKHERDDSVTTPEASLGFKIGSRHLRHDQLCDYMEQLAAESDRVTLLPYATSHGGRPLFVLVITSPENHQQLKAIRNSHRQLASGNVETPREDDRVVMYMGYGVHGDEASALNATPLVAYHLASSLDPIVTDMLAQSVLLLDPSLNPDGGSRFEHWVNENRGRLASSDPVDREHLQGWPRGRTNYYWFDLNRDWLPATHPESRGRLELFHQWKPNVVLDYHEMGSSSSYFFQPGVRARTNPLTPSRNVTLTKQFAINHANAMDSAGELFFTEERFDDFYIGKGSTYPDVNGAIGILFEQGSSRGLLMKTDRTERTFSDSIANQVRTSLSSLKSMTQYSDDLLRFQCQFFANAKKQGALSSSYLLSGESSRVHEAKQLLSLHDISFHQPNASVLVNGKLCSTDEVLLIPCDQPQSTLLRSMMSMAQTFEENIFYDVSTWHLPSAMDLDVQEIAPGDSREMIASFGEKTEPSPAPMIAFDDRHLGYAVLPTSLQIPKLIAQLHREDAKLRVTTEPITIEMKSESVECPEGTLLVLRQPNLDAWPGILNRLKLFPASSSMQFVPLTSSMTSGGPDLGSDSTMNMVVAKPALIVGDGVDPYTAGAIWHHLDVRVEQPTTLINTISFPSVDLAEYTALLLPKGSYGLWGNAEAIQLKEYLDDGGVVITIGDSVQWLIKQNVIGSLDEHHDDSNDDPHEVPSAPETRPFGKARDAAALESIAGAMFKTVIDRTHPLAYGFPDEFVPAFRRGTYHFPLPENSYQTAAIYQGVISGYVSEKNREMLKGTAAVFMVPVGKGRVIVLADNPVFRGYVRSTEPFLTNSIYLGPSVRLPRQTSDEHVH